MSEARSLLATVQTAAATGAGLIVSVGLGLPSLRAGFISGTLTTPLHGLEAASVVVVAALVVTVPRKMRFGAAWAAAAVGAVAVLVAQTMWRFYIGIGPGLGGLALAVAGLGLVLGGALLAAGSATGRPRLAIIAGLVVGVVVAPPLERLSPVALPGPDAPSGSSIVQWLATGLVVAAALAVGAQERRAGTSPPGVSVRDSAALPVLGVALAAIFADGVRQIALMLTPVADQFTGERAGAMWRAATALALAALITLVLALLAVRRAGMPGVRWVVTGAAVGQVLAVLSLWWTPDGPAPLLVPILLAVLGAAGGAVGAWTRGRLLPWDGVGVLVMAVAAAMAWPAWGFEAPWMRWMPAAVLLAGCGMAMGAGLARLARVTDAALSAADFVGAGVFGFAAAILAGQVLGSTMWEPPDDGVGGLTLAFFFAVVAVVLAELFVREHKRRGNDV
jgi:hypothetical protein